MIFDMSEKWIEVEGVDLAEAIEKACSQLGLPREQIDYDFDLSHFKGGASTTRIFAGRKNPRSTELGAAIEERVGALLEAQNLDAQVAVRVTLFAVQIELRAPELGMGDEAVRTFATTLEKDLEEYLDGRPLRVSLRGFGSAGRVEHPRRERRGRHDERGRYASRPRGSEPNDRGERDENIRRRARRAIERVLSGNGPASLEDLNSYERRLVHLTAREFDGVISQSVGDGIRKDVLIERDHPEE